MFFKRLVCFLLGHKWLTKTVGVLEGYPPIVYTYCVRCPKDFVGYELEGFDNSNDRADEASDSQDYTK